MKPIKCNKCGIENCDNKCRPREEAPRDNAIKRKEKGNHPQRVWPTGQEKDKGRKI